MSESVNVRQELLLADAVKYSDGNDFSDEQFAVG